jgi:hypothetical protein
MHPGLVSSHSTPPAGSATEIEMIHQITIVFEQLSGVATSRPKYPASAAVSSVDHRIEACTGERAFHNR